ncbi:TIGR03618 family F420-dependent PPOX class oxidoreductase [Allosaccharopolyspora coralli]|uniref:TIGR03618 family F420-dependent PPOX class oxidoreductase n=1 Tax=Allosaccharopolyspora coralli TaxID=2665642 RepID=A0A5Q3QG97_9PSEU|nr:PPOX class F420-dependent oxidoreductase [Allosaccharopolyspora coralli]QGK69837.1 TIGR03618 family F420-dependent PPOX class oxidoreductase [Allosaccharopolyspora coralli]
MAANTSNGPELMTMTEELAAGPNFAAVSTVFPSGKIQTQMIWVGMLDGTMVLNTETHRAKTRNVGQDERITVLVRDEADPYRYAEVRGRVTETTTGARARSHLDQLAQKYTGHDYPEENIKSERVILWIEPERQTLVDQKRGVGE